MQQFHTIWKKAEDANAKWILEIRFVFALLRTRRQLCSESSIILIIKQVDDCRMVWQNEDGKCRLFTLNRTNLYSEPTIMTSNRHSQISNLFLSIIGTLPCLGRSSAPARRWEWWCLGCLRSSLWRSPRTASCPGCRQSCAKCCMSWWSTCSWAATKDNNINTGIHQGIHAFL